MTQDKKIALASAVAGSGLAIYGWFETHEQAWREESFWRDQFGGVCQAHFSDTTWQIFLKSREWQAFVSKNRPSILGLFARNSGKAGMFISGLMISDASLSVMSGRVSLSLRRDNPIQFNVSEKDFVPIGILGGINLIALGALASTLEKRWDFFTMRTPPAFTDLCSAAQAAALSYSGASGTFHRTQQTSLSPVITTAALGTAAIGIFSALKILGNLIFAGLETAATAAFPILLLGTGFRQENPDRA